MVRSEDQCGVGCNCGLSAVLHAGSGIGSIVVCLRWVSFGGLLPLLGSSRAEAVMGEMPLLVAIKSLNIFFI